MRKITFTKMHGAGNDYIYVDTTRNNVENAAELAVSWSRRHDGIGSDGLVLIGRSPVPEADFTMRIFNADGSEATMCGNASRCIGKYVYERGLTDKTTVRLLTLSGVKVLRLNLRQPAADHHGVGSTVESVTVDMGQPSVPEPLTIETAQGPFHGTFVSMGNPHFVVFTDDADSVDLEHVGPLLEHHHHFPDRSNIEFAQVRSDGTVRTRVWERGSGITQACGTGACATAVALTRRQTDVPAPSPVTIVMDGGRLQVSWQREATPGSDPFLKPNHVYLTGPAEFVFDGEIAVATP